MTLSPEQVKIIKSTVPVLQEHGNEITLRFYRACKYSVVAWFSRARAANSLYKRLIIR